MCVCVCVCVCMCVCVRGGGGGEVGRGVDFIKILYLGVVAVLINGNGW